MAVYGFGFNYSGYKSQLEQFLEAGKVCIGWSLYKKYFHERLHRIVPGDLIFLKTFILREQTLRVYAIGIVKEPLRCENYNDSGEKCIKVEWLWSSEQPVEIKDLRDGCISRGTTVYEELNLSVIQHIISILKELTTK